jgi:predicted TIM-barrel fold metal-dependent hydrolase
MNDVRRRLQLPAIGLIVVGALNLLSASVLLLGRQYLRALVRAGLGKRLMFGSDQMVWPEGIGMAVEGIESASFLTEEQKRDIFYNNAVRFLRLDEKKLLSSSSK